MTFPLFLDTADPVAWRTWLPTGLFAGVTTNPVLMHRAGRPVTPSAVADAMRELREIDTPCGRPEIQVQAWGDTADAMVALAEYWCRDASPIVKLPATKEGFAAAARLTRQGVPVTVTAVYAAAQIVPALAVRAAYIAPYVGRIDEAGGDAEGMIATMARAIEASGADTRILLASVRTPEQLARAVGAGATAATLSPDLAGAVCGDPKTATAVADFDAVSDFASLRDMMGETQGEEGGS